MGIFGNRLPFQECTKDINVNVSVSVEDESDILDDFYLFWLLIAQ